MRLSVGDKLGQYEILSPLGAGGMGEVYRARDLQLDREVALKVLPDRLAADSEAGPRFKREAKALAALSHPNILTLFTFGSEGDVSYAVSELLEGKTLGEVIKGEGVLDWHAVLDIGRAVGEGLAAAHAKGITHRDIKPANLFVTTEGVVQILDFGLAKSMPLEPVTEDDLTLEQPEGATSPGVLLGTVGYMSPEQAREIPATPASDVFSFGCVLYEMLTGINPFARSTQAETLAAVLGEAPEPFDAAAGIPAEFQRIVIRAMEKDPSARYATAAGLRDDLAGLHHSIEQSETGSLWGAIRRPRVALPLILLAVLSVFAAVRAWQRSAQQAWARGQALPEVARLIEAEEYADALALARAVERVIPDDPMLSELWGEMSNTISVDTDPPGAEVSYRVNTALEIDWTALGKSPISGHRLPLGGFRLLVEKEGFVSREVLSALSYPQQDGTFGPLPRFSTPEERNRFSLRLDPEGIVPPGMVAVDGGDHYIMPIGGLPSDPVAIGSFFIDRTEVSNSDYRAFVDAGGYERPELWRYEFRRGAEVLTREEAMAELVDTTGRPGPSTWELGDYPEGEEDYPVGGVSWYEAAAYAEFRGLALPTVFHWARAALPGSEHVLPLGPQIIPLSNFGVDGPAPVGSYPGIGVSGAADLAGNVREWCWNASGVRRVTLGGGWNEPTYTFSYGSTLEPLDRSSINGFRCIKERSGETAEHLKVSVELPWYDFRKMEPLTDQEFAFYQGLFAYVETQQLDPKLESVDDSFAGWRRESVSIDAAYEGERFTVHLDFPKRGSPPYHAVLYFPGSNAMEQDTFEEAYWERFDYIPKSGRVLVRPIMAGMYERSGDGEPGRERTVKWLKDLRRTLDYLESRDDINPRTFGYMGLSNGGWIAPVVLTVEQRFRAAVLIGGGLWGKTTPRFSSRVTTPLLMLNGRYDSQFPLETHQEPLIELISTPEADKRHVVYEAGHLPLPRAEMIKEILAWLDRYQGEVER